ncbi:MULTISPECIES: CBM35 domain-containing protein [unclassified Streptomyces]|uniref:Carbohydrate-binding protein n=1 Tax=Streptomyces sp. NBC_00060 TaxID=2975636 RepID=A0AAU2H3D9_9ACTN
MTPGNNGASTPEDDDPFGYLYEDGQASGATPPRSGGYGYPGPSAPQQPGVPRTSYNQVRTVGERQYGQVPQQQYGQPPQAPYGQQPQQYGQQQYGQPAAQYAAPETYGGAPNRPGPPADGGGGRGSRGPNTKGLLIGAVAVVAAVVIGIGVALLSNGDGKKDDDAGKPAGGGSTGASQQPSNKPSDSTPSPAAELPKQDAATLKLGGSSVLAKDVKGAQGTDGAYVSGFNQIGASLTWQADLPSSGGYYLYVRYATPAKEANATVTVNGKPNAQPVRLGNFIGSSDPNLEKNWQTTWTQVTLKQGQNTIKFSCEQGNQCDAVFDWVEISKTKKSY